MPARKIPDADLDALLRALGARITRGDLGRMLRCGRFTLLHPIGRGGVAQVFAAIRDGEESPAHAVKLFDPGVDAEDMLARFEAERKLIGAVAHPCVITVVDSGLHESGVPWFAMPLVDGSAITAECDDRMLTIRSRMALVSAACEGLAAAHARGIIHRDIKPGNVIASCRGERHTVRIIDFGLARALAGRGPRLTPLSTVHRMGTPDYMSPEQWSDGIAACDARADVFSLGMLIAELVAGVIARTRRSSPAQGTTARTPARRRARKAPAAPCAPSESLAQLIREDPAAASGLARLRRMGSSDELLHAVRSRIDPLVSPMLAEDPRDRPEDALAALQMIEMARRAL
ncbi:MAG: serine/threonine protein kinase [Phycisphaerales bacterium]|nr:serine/threonine protein kinase [Phycisphaerales bacterium]